MAEEEGPWTDFASRDDSGPWQDFAKPERGVLERAGQAMEETGSGAMEAMNRAFIPPTKEEARKYLGPSGMLRSFKETGEALLAPITGTIGAGLAGAESLAASALGPAQRGLDYAVAKGVGVVSPETGQQLEARIPSSEAAYEAARPYVSAAAGALRAAPPGVPPAMPPLPNRGPLGVTLTEGEMTGSLPAIKREQAATRAQAGEPAYEHAQAFREQQTQQIEAIKKGVAAEFDPLKQEIAETPQEAGKLVSEGVTSARDIVKGGVRAAYKVAQEKGGEIHVGAFEGMPQRIKGDLTLSDDPVIIDNRITPAASSMIDYLDTKIGNLKIQNKADPFGPPRMDDPDLRGVSLKGIDQWRKNLGAIRKSAATREDQRAAGRVMDAFDERIDRAVNEGLYTGDPDAVQAWNAARAAHADYRSTFTERGKDPIGRVVEKILGRGLEDPATPNDVMSFITGASGVSPNSLNVAVTKRLKKILGQDSPEWIATKQGIWRKLAEKPEDMKDFGPRVIGNRLGEFLNGKGKALAEEVYSTQERELMRSYIDLMDKIAVPQAGANWSNNDINKIANGTAKAIKYVGTVIGGYLGHRWGAGILGAEAAGAGIGYTAGRLAEKIQGTAKLRQIRRQMPLIAQHFQQWQKAVAKGQNPSELGLMQAISAQFGQPSLPSRGFDEKGQGMKSGGYVKVGKASVQYGKGMRSSHCGICKYYLVGGKCQKVREDGPPTPGQISPAYWCKLFEKGASRDGRMQAGGVAMSSGVPVGPDGLPIDQGPPPAPPPVPVSEPPPVEPGIQAIHDQLMAGPPPDVLGTGDPWSSVGGPPGGEYSAVLTDPNVLGYFHIDQFGIVTPKVMPPQRTDFQNPLGYTRGDWAQPEQGGFFTISDLYNRIDRDLPGLFQAGSNLPSTNNWRLIPGGAPGTVMRNGQIVSMGAEAEAGLPAGVDTSFSDTAESGVAGIHRRVALGLGTPWGYPGIYRSGLYWPGGPIMGYERWPYATNVKRGGRVGRLQAGGGLVP